MFQELKEHQQEDINNLTSILLRMCNSNGITDSEFVIDLIENSLLPTDQQLVYTYFKNKLQQEPKFDVTIFNKVFKSKWHEKHRGKIYLSKVVDIIFNDKFEPDAVRLLGDIFYSIEEFNEKFEEYKEN